MIALRDLHKGYDVGTERVSVLRGVTLDIGAGEMVAIMGASGSGKSTLLNVLGLLDGYDAGTYHLDGRLVRDLSEAAAAKLRNEHLGFVFQSFHLLPFKTAAENVALPLVYRGTGRRVRMAEARDILDRVGLTSQADRLPSQLSGGQKQRVAIARALVTRPAVLLADEPTGALDSATSHDIMELLVEVNGSGQTVVVVTHERAVATRCSRVIVVRDGLVVDG